MLTDRATWRTVDGVPKDVAIKCFESEQKRGEFHIEQRQLARFFLFFLLKYRQCGGSGDY